MKIYLHTLAIEYRECYRRVRTYGLSTKQAKEFVKQNIKNAGNCSICGNPALELLYIGDYAASQSFERSNPSFGSLPDIFICSDCIHKFQELVNIKDIKAE